MSKDILVAKRYAKALFEVAKEHKKITQVEEDLRTIVDAVQTNEDLRKLLSHPNIDTDFKTDIVKKLFNDKGSDILLSTLQLLFERGRETLLSHLLHDYMIIANEELGQAIAIVKTPFALSESGSKEVAAKFSKITGKTIHVQNVVDPSIIGGMEVRIGDRLYDGTLIGKLERLEQKLIQA